MKETGVIPYEDAVALIVVPPLNRDPVTKERPTPSSSPERPPPEREVKIRGKSKRRLVSQMYAAETVEEREDIQLKDEEYELIPHPAKIPLYHGPALFPVRSQRAALHNALKNLLQVEIRARIREGPPKKTKRDQKQQGAASDGGGQVTQGKKAKWQRPKGDQKPSQVYVLCSDSETLLRADMVPLLVALWRVRMWEGQGWVLPWRERWKLKPRPLPA